VNEPVILYTANKQRMVLLDGDMLTMRVQTLDGHNRAVAKLSWTDAEILYDTLGVWLGVDRVFDQ
jgi:hypothetical protein